MAKVAVILGSDSDWVVMEPGYRILRDFGISVDVLVASAHRTPQAVQDFVVPAKERGTEVIIAVAGAAAHLPGTVAAHTILPVIGVPVAGKALGGMDALLSIAQMPAGVPVGTMAIDGGRNAALYAASILALQNEDLARRLLDFREAQAEAVYRKNEALRTKIEDEEKKAKPER
ncbi:MAG: 5-(carboxyamino)imidazole ribonucleotide mutase [Synergistaceae bacterium]|jgi:5-(carboxyamino)imidazole ribonucleotide mutase|nr:5-(carboxyamino)imidazole ribonucleotide mutase [Synergistaceae bacterium]